MERKASGNHGFERESQIETVLGSRKQKTALSGESRVSEYKSERGSSQPLRLEQQREGEGKLREGQAEEPAVGFGYAWRWRKERRRSAGVCGLFYRETYPRVDLQHISQSKTVPVCLLPPRRCAKQGWQRHGVHRIHCRCHPSRAFATGKLHRCS